MGNWKRENARKPTLWKLACCCLDLAARATIRELKRTQTHPPVKATCLWMAEQRKSPICQPTYSFLHIPVLDFVINSSAFNFLLPFSFLVCFPLIFLTVDKCILFQGLDSAQTLYLFFFGGGNLCAEDRQEEVSCQSITYPVNCSTEDRIIKALQMQIAIPSRDKVSQLTP